MRGVPHSRKVLLRKAYANVHYMYYRTNKSLFFTNSSQHCNTGRRLQIRVGLPAQLDLFGGEPAAAAA